ncbi:MAG: SPOR domain-containing protein [Flavobacteriaceae bacterium]|nr:SPOR domain-containing protein [Flavobacteriaceae bacterium]
MKRFQYFLIIILFPLTFQSLYSQNRTTEIQPNDLKELLKIRQKLERENKLKEAYKIQIFSGDLEEAKQIKKEFDKNIDFTWESKMIFETPNYKVWVGHYRNRLEADRALALIIEEFEDALILRPGRN